MTDSDEFVSVDRADELEVVGCRIEGADRLGGSLGLGEDTFIAAAGLEGPEVLTGGSVLTEAPFTAGKFEGEPSLFV